jgi:hypothetical protein
MATISNEILELTLAKSVYDQYIENNQASSLKIGALGLNELDHHYEILPPFKCRELLSIALIASTVCDGAPEVSRLEMEDKKMSTDCLRLSANITNSSHMESFLRYFPKFIDTYDKALGAESTVVYRTTEKNALIIIGDPKWISSPLILSVFTMVMRLSTLIPERVNDPDLSLETAYSLGFFNRESIELMEAFFRGLDIKLLLKEYKYILGDSPMTGIDDEALSRVYLEDMDSEDLVRSNLIDSDLDLGFNFYDLRGYSGFESLYTMYIKIRDNVSNRSTLDQIIMKLNSPRVVGLKWAMNYSLKVKEANENIR